MGITVCGRLSHMCKCLSMVHSEADFGNLNVDDCWWLNSLPVSEETEFYVVVHCSGEVSPF
jgi:hypothetical protein